MLFYSKNRKEVENEESNKNENNQTTNVDDSYFENDKNEINESSFGNFKSKFMKIYINL
jgi:hypothetical protein